MANDKELLTDILRYAAERGIAIPADLLLDISRRDAQALVDAKQFKLTLKPSDLPIFTLKKPGAVPAPGKAGLVLYSTGWEETPPMKTVYMGIGGNTVTDHAALSNLDYATAGHTGFQPTLTAAAALALILTVDGAGSGLDADLLDGQHGAYYLPAASYTAADVLAKLLTVDGTGSLLDADLLDGQHATAFQTALTFPLAPNLGGTGIANAAGSTLTLGAATSITGGGTIALGGFTLTVPATGTAALTLNNLSVFAATTSAQLAGVLSDETGTGLAVFNAQPTLTNAAETCQLRYTRIREGCRKPDDCQPDQYPGRR